MSLNVHLYREKWTSYDAGVTLEKEDEEVYWANITHNLNTMADNVSIQHSTLYYYLWRPEEIEITIAKHLIYPLTIGLAKLKDNPDFYKTFDASNGWGTYENFVPFVEEYLDACKKFPEAKVEVSR